MKPHRIQLSRKKGWRKPPNTVLVSRPAKWGNPYRIGQKIKPSGIEITVDVQEAVDQFRMDITHGLLEISEADVRKELRGKNLACWCPLDQPCHADVLLELANA